MKVSDPVLTLMNDFENALEDKVHTYCLKDSLNDCSTPARQLISNAMLYSLRAGGKRLRPMLLLEMAFAYNGDMKAAQNFACALEMIHTYSLIHDDLPSMDNDDLRRGKPTNHIVFGEDIAILAGDGLLNLSSELMLDTVIEHGGSVRMMRAMREILNAAGSSGMILGQVADIKYHENLIDLEKLDFINTFKTGKLLTAALIAGATVGDASDSEIRVLGEIGILMGLLFQIVDDVLDVVGDQAKMGKRTQIDSRNDKTTYPGMLGLDRTNEIIGKIRIELKEKVDQLSIDKTYLYSLIDFLVEREY